MFKFQLKNFLSYDFSLVDRDDKGKVLFETRVEFYGGETTPDFKGGTFHTESDKIAKLLRKHPWFGEEFFEIETPQSLKKAKESAPKKVVEEEVAPQSEREESETNPEKTLSETSDIVDENSDSVDENEENTGITVFAEITTVQEAARKVRELDPTVKTAELRTINQINTVAERLNISFPNL